MNQIYILAATSVVLQVIVVQVSGFAPSCHHHLDNQNFPSPSCPLRINNKKTAATTNTYSTFSPIFSSQEANEEGRAQSPQYYGNFFDEITDFDNDDDEEEEYPNLEDEFEDYVPKINSVTLVGRVGNDPEPRYFNDNKVVLRLSLAVKRKYHPLERQVRNIKSGEEETDWFNLELWGRDAEYAGKYVTKGARIGISGRLNVDTWTDKVTGEERSSKKIVVRHLDILESRAEAELRMGNRGKYGGNNQGGGGYDGNYGGGGGGGGSQGGGAGFDYGDGPSSAGKGGFFDDN